MTMYREIDMQFRLALGGHPKPASRGRLKAGQ
jgi:hypothetical protein